MDLNRPYRSGGLLGALIDKMKDEEYRSETFYPALLDLGYDLAPVTGEVRSGLRADAAFGRAGQQIEQGQYLPAAGSLAEGTSEWLGAIPALGVALSAPMDIARAGKKLLSGGKKLEARAEKVEPMPTVDKGLIGPDIPYSKPGTLTTGEITPEAVLAVAGGKKKKGTKTNPYGENYGSELLPDGTYKDQASFEARYAANPPRSLYEGYESKPSISGDEFPNLERRVAPKGAKARTADAVQNPDLRRKLIEKALEGQKIMGGKRWYPTNELYQYYVEELGEEAGKAKFIRDMHIQAASSTNTKMQDLPKVAAWYQYQAAQGMPISPPPAGSGVGHKYSASSHAPAVEEYLKTGMLDHTANPKRSTFVQNLLGREDQVTIDKHNVRAIGMLSGDPRFLKTKVEISDVQAEKYRDMGIDVSVRDKVHGKTGAIEKIYEFRPQDAANKGLLPMEEAQKTPILWVEAADAKNEYKYLEEMQQSIAKELNMTPAEFQENLWIGAGQMTGLGSPPERAIDTIEKRVRYTAERLGADPEEVMRAYVRGDIPLAQRQDMMQQYGGLLG